MNYKNYALLALLLTSPLVKSQFAAFPVLVSKKNPVESSPVQPQGTSATKPACTKGWLSSKYDALKKSVGKGLTAVKTTVSSAWKKTTNGVSSGFKSASNSVGSTISTYPKLSAVAGGALSYFIIKPCMEYYDQVKAENKPVITASLGALVGASIAGLYYAGKLSGIRPAVIASFVAGVYGAGLADHVYTNYESYSQDSGNAKNNAF